MLILVRTCKRIKAGKEYSVVIVVAVAAAAAAALALDIVRVLQ